LLVRWPGHIESGLRIHAITHSIDLLPTVFDAFGQAIPDVHGRSLLPLLRQEDEQVRSYACSCLVAGESAELALRSPDWSFLLPLRVPASDPPRRAQLYARPEDRWEVNNLTQHHLEFADALERTLRQFAETACQPGPLHAPELPAERPDAIPVNKRSSS
jgi:arylsulfatase A-like enzyme